MADLFQLANASDLMGFEAEFASQKGYTLPLNPAQISDMTNHYNALRASPNPPPVNNTTSKAGSTSGKYSPSSGGGNLITRALTAASSKPQGAQETWTTAGGIADTISKFFSKNPLSIASGFDDIKDKIGGYAIEYIDQQRQLLETINQETGILNETSDGLRREITNTIPVAAQLGISFQEMASSVTDMVVESGRFKLIDSQTIERVALASKFVGTMNDTMKMMPSFQEISMGVADATKVIEKSGLSSTKLGLNARETVKTLSTNLEKLNQFGFKAGIDGLNRMVQKAQELRMSMETVLGIADKVMDPEKALEMSANLQVIGGSLGDFNDPIKMMYMATNDVEGLQDALAKSAESLVTFNQEQGRFQIFGGDLRRAKAMAAEMGISYKELSNIAIQSAQRTSAAADLMSSGLQMSDEDREFITNMAQMKDGKMVIEVPETMRKSLGMDMKQTTLALDSLDEKMLQGIMVQKEGFAELKIEDIAQRQYTVMSNIEHSVNAILYRLQNSVGNVISGAVNTAGINRDTKNSVNSMIYDATKTINSGIKIGEDKATEFIEQIPSWFKNIPKPAPVAPPVTNTVVPQKETPKPETKSEGKTATVEKTTHDVNINIRSSQPLVDSLTSELMKSANFAKEVEGSFLEVFNPVT